MERKALSRRLNSIFALMCVIKLLLIFFIFFSLPLIRLIFGDGGEGIVLRLSDSSGVPGIVYSVFGDLLCVALPVAVWYAVNKSTVRKETVFPVKKAGALPVCCTVAATYFTGYCFAFGFAFVALLFCEAFGIAIPQPSVDVPSDLPSFLLQILSVAVLPAVFEELACRGAVMGGLKRYGAAFALVVSSVCFSMLHNTLGQLPFALGAGLALGYCVLRFGSARVGIAAHFVNNFLSCVLQYLAARSGISQGSSGYGITLADPAAFAGMVAVYAVIVIFVSVFGVIFLVRYKIRDVDESAAETAVNPVGAVFRCPMAYVFLALFIASVVLYTLHLFS